MRLVIISDMAHFRSNGQVLGWGPTVQEIDHLAGLFDEVFHIACLHDSDRHVQSALPYTAPNVRLLPVAPVGGRTAVDKLKVVSLYPRYASVILRTIRQADAVHVRCPANISLLAILLLAFVRRPASRWIKYAGSWEGYDGEAWTYAFQRWWLKHGFCRAWVTVNGNWEDQSAHIRTFLNPCLTDEELTEARGIGASKELSSPLRLLFVGKLTETKGVFRALEVVGKLRERGLPAKLDIVGDGPDRQAVDGAIASGGLTAVVAVHGWVPRTQIASYYADSHLLLLPSRSEGWPKVVSEAMAFGVVPIASAVSSIPQYLNAFGAGLAVPFDDVDAFVSAAASYAARPWIWKEESVRAMRAASAFTYERYRAAVADLFKEADSRSVDDELLDEAGTGPVNAEGTDAAGSGGMHTRASLPTS